MLTDWKDSPIDCIPSWGNNNNLSSSLVVEIISYSQLSRPLHLELWLKTTQSLLFLHAYRPSKTFYKLKQHHWYLLFVDRLMLLPHLSVRWTIAGEVLTYSKTTFITSSVPFLTGSSATLRMLAFLMITLCCIFSSSYFSRMIREARGEKMRLALIYSHFTSYPLAFSLHSLNSIVAPFLNMARNTGLVTFFLWSRVGINEVLFQGGGHAKVSIAQVLGGSHTEQPATRIMCCRWPETQC